MGIDIYARWQGQTKAEGDAQNTGFSVVHGRVGYLREAYHGEPYATRFLCQEAFTADEGQAVISARVLRERLPATLEMVEEREKTLYGETDVAVVEAVKRSFTDFVALCEQKEAETGVPVTILASY